MKNPTIEFNLNGGVRGLKGDTGEDGISPIVSLDKQGNNLTVSVTDKEGTKSETITQGDMYKSTYDTDGDGVVDNANKVNGHTVETNVPAEAVFTDTIYDDSDIKTDILNLELYKADKSNTYTKAEVDSLIPDTSDFITKSVSDLVYYYKKSETYTQTEINNLISAAAGLKIQVVQTLPTQDISTSTIYLVPKLSSQTNNVYNEYIYVSDGASTPTYSWELIGDTAVDLSNYVQKTDYGSASAAGLIKTGNCLAINSSTGAVSAEEKSYVDYLTSGPTIFVSKGTLNNVIKGLNLIIQYSSVPIAGSTNVDQIIQYTGSTTQDYTNGYFYKCVNNLGTYSWDEIDVQDHQDISGKENTSNKVTSLSSLSTDTQYPSAKCVYDNLSGKQGTIQYSTMPTASSSNVGQIVQYTGTTTNDYTNGYFYECVEDSNVYSWENINVQAGGGLPSDLTKIYLCTSTTGGSSGELFDVCKKIWNDYKNGIKSAMYLQPAHDYMYTEKDKVGLYYFFVDTTWNSKYLRRMWQTNTINNYSSYTMNDGNCGNISFTITNNELSSVSFAISQGNDSYTYLTTNYDYPTPYTPQYAGSPATKKYVDDTSKITTYQLSGLSEYSSSSTYAVGDYVYYNNLIYKCNTAVAVAEAFDNTKWTQKTYMEYMSEILVGTALQGSY